MEKYDYKGINLRGEYIRLIDEKIRSNPFIKSRADFVRRAIEYFIKTEGAK